MQRVELFFHVCTDKMQRYIVRPESLDHFELSEITACICAKYDQKDENKEMYYKFMQVESYLKELHQNPDPTSIKLTSSWYSAVVKKGSIIFRFGFDGRRDAGGRMTYSIEGAFLEGVSLERAENKFQKRGIDIINVIGKSLPDSFELLLIKEKQELFNEIKEQCIAKNRLDNLFDCFYNACYFEDIKISQNISVPELPKYGLFDDIEHTKKKLKKLKDDIFWEIRN